MIIFVTEPHRSQLRYPVHLVTGRKIAVGSRYTELAGRFAELERGVREPLTGLVRDGRRVMET